MATCYAPMAGEQAYESLRQRFPKGFPDAYKVWRFKQDQEGAKLQGSGHTVVPVQIGSEEFVRHCDQNESACTAHALDRFAGQAGLGAYRAT